MQNPDYDDLTPAEMQILEGLDDPDGGDIEGQFQWEDHFQRSILGLLVNDKNFLISSQSVLKPDCFVDDVHKLVCKLVYEYFEKYETLPLKRFVVQEVKDSIAERNEDIQLHYLTELELVYDHYAPGIEHRDYLLEKITNFAKMQELKKAFHTCVDYMKRENKDTWTNIETVLTKALQINVKFEEGMYYFDSFDTRYAEKEDDVEKEVFTSGFEAIDKGLLAGGPTRGEMYSWVGLSGTGKSLALVRAALLNITMLGKRVLYVSLEMDEAKIAERFDAQLACVDINRLEENKELVKKAMDEEVADFDDKRMFVIKQFAAGEMDVNMLRGYMNQLKLRGFVPDLVIVDYIGEMKDKPNVPIHESRGTIVKELRGLAMKEDMCVLTAMQPNRSARAAINNMDRFGANLQGDPVIDDDNLGDSFQQIQPLDGCWSINQTRVEKKAELARIFVIKHRHGKSRYTFHVKYDVETLAITQIDQREYSAIMKQQQHEAEVMAADMPPSSPDGKLGKEVQKHIKSDMGYQVDDGPDCPESPLPSM